MTIKAEPYTHDPLYSDRTYTGDNPRPYEKMYRVTTGGNFVDDVEQLIRKNYKECPYCHKPIQEFIMGYPVRDLLVLLESLRLNGIRPEDVKKHTLDIEFAYQSVMKALEEQMNKMFKGRAEMSRQLPEIYTIPYDQYIREHGISIMEYFARLKQADKGEQNEQIISTARREEAFDQDRG